MRNESIDKFILQATLIDPISDIITKLENKEFRDCDIKWLNEKLNKFTVFALETLGKNFSENDYLLNNDNILNKYKINSFLKAFRTLFFYFKSF